MQNEITYDPSHPPLTSEETAEASKKLIRKYPAVDRHKIDPQLTGQVISNVSFMLLKEPTQDGVHGFIKIRGVWPDEERANVECENMIKNIDSTVPIHQLRVGYWHPLTNNEKYTSDQMDVQTRDCEMALRDRAAKQAALKNAQLRKELDERKEDLKNVEGSTDDPTSLNYYTMKKVSQNEIKGYYKQAFDKLEKFKKDLKESERIIKDMNKKYPKYQDMWLDNLNTQRVKAGLPEITEDDLNKIESVGPITM